MPKCKKKNDMAIFFLVFFTFPVFFFHFHADYVAICVADDYSGSHFHHRATAADLLCQPSAAVAEMPHGSDQARG